MAVRMRLIRMGKKKQPMYRVVVVDGRAQRDGRYIEQIGRYEPLHDPSIVEIDNERAADWLSKGAQPSETVEKLLNISGAMNTMKVKTGAIHVVGVSRVEAPEIEESASSDEDASESAAEAIADAPVTSEEE
jgi:small subunit ribosomal protein S16